MAPLNFVTRAEADVGVRRNQEVKNWKVLILDRRCWAWGLTTGLPGKGSKDILALEPQIIALEMAGTLKRGSQTVSPPAPGYPGL